MMAPSRRRSKDLSKAARNPKLSPVWDRVFGLVTGVILVATVVTAVVYIWALNASTVYERRATPTDEQQPARAAQPPTDRP